MYYPTSSTTLTHTIPIPRCNAASSETEIDKEMKKEKEEKKEKKEKEEKSISYDVYKSFWEFQAFFVSDKPLIESVGAWKDFMAHAKVGEWQHFTD